MFLDKVESGLLLYQTPQGLVPVEPSFWQRVYLLWTFRNFRQLSLPLLNPREAAMVTGLFREHAGDVLHRYDSGRVIGVVENFVPPAIAVDEKLADTIDAALAMKARLPEEVAEPIPAPDAMPAVVPAAQIEAAPAVQEVLPAQEEAPVPMEIATEAATDTSFAPSVASSTSAKPAVGFRSLAYRLAATAGVLSLCVVSVLAWQWMQAIPESQANTRPQFQQVGSAPSAPQITPHIAELATVAQSPAPVAAPIADAQPVGAPAAAVEVASVTQASIRTVEPGAKRTGRIHDAVRTSKTPLSAVDSSILASRPPLRYAYPVYTETGGRGVVAMTAIVNSDGTVRSVKVVSGPRALAAAAVRAVRQWRYGPYVKDGEPVATETNIVISFFSADAISVSFPRNIAVNR